VGDAVAAAIQIVGAFFILVPFAWQQLGDLDADTPVYLWPNMLGSAILATLALDGRQWGFLILETAWFIVAVRGLVMLRRHTPAV
jgi:hypothetical protein